MNLLKYILPFPIFLLSAVFSGAQSWPNPDYPKDYFQWPLKLAPALVANFGELRPNHYHMGLDCRTEQKQNQLVLAAAPGYIAKVKIEPFGFGRCIYINHPNGMTTVYAHLNDFNPDLEKYVTAQQYSLKSWKVFLDIPAGLFPVTKGQFIAFSGTTGGSSGPHLHFEIRDTKTDKVLNPLLFGLPVTDKIAPDILRLAVYDRNLSTYEQSPQLLMLKQKNGVYAPLQPLLRSGSSKVSFGISAFDRYTGSTSHNGIFQALIFENDLPVIGFRMNDIGYDETRFLNAHIDYKLRASGGPFVQHLSRLPGYPEGIYKNFNGNGVINLADDSIHRIRIEVKDAAGNSSELRFDIRYDPAITKKAGPSSVIGATQKEFYPGTKNGYLNESIVLLLDEKCLYDSFRFQYAETAMPGGNPLFHLHNNTVPLHLPFFLKIKGKIPTGLREKVMVQRSWNSKYSYAVGEPMKGQDEGWFMTAFREFGDFRLLVDTLPPLITPIGFTDGMNMYAQKRLAFIVTDNTDDLRSFTATLDGKWLRFSNDKGKIFIHNFDEMCPPGHHELVVTAEDAVGNRTEKRYHFVK